MLSRRTHAFVLAGALMISPASANTDVLLEWNAIMITTLSGQSPVEQARLAAITQLAVFEATNAIVGDYVPYVGTIIAPHGASAEAAVIGAAHRALRAYVPESAATLDAARAKSLATIPNGPSKEKGLALGMEAADVVMALRVNDGALPPQFYLPTSTEPGAWQLTPTCPSENGVPLGGVSLQWRHVTPFGIKTSDQFRSEPPPELDSHRYQNDLDEVRKVGASDSTERPPDRADVARFYAGVLATPLWNAVATQLAAGQGRSLSENARALALVNIAINDAVIAVFDTKYHYTFWRPETAIRAASTVGDSKRGPEPAFTPFVPTPCHPSYPSAHASAAYAAREVLRRIYGERGHAIGLSAATVPDVKLRYDSLAQITHDIDDARVYGGIHFRFDQRAGHRQGRQVGAYIYRHILRRAHDTDSIDDTEMGR
jgi:hypothetical protein